MFYTNPHKMMGTERMMEETAVMCQQRCSQAVGGGWGRLGAVGGGWGRLGAVGDGAWQVQRAVALLIYIVPVGPRKSFFKDLGRVEIQVHTTSHACAHTHTHT